MNASLNHNITDKSITELARQCPNLNTLDITCSDVHDNAMIQLAIHYSDLTLLDISGCDNITDERMTYLVQHCSSLQELHIGGCD